MMESAKNLAVTPRVFISYARSDGQDFATELRTRLEAESIPLWQDRIAMEGGRDWWLQIVEALNQVEFMVLVMTPSAMQSPMVRKEWRYARQQGVCVYPVKAKPDLDFASLPRWMRDTHFYDLDYEWTKFVNDLNTSCQQHRVPFMVEDLPPDFVPRSIEFDQLISKLLDKKREEPIAITAALRGAGGYGKTTMARAVCHNPSIQEAFDEGILWVTLGEDPGNLVGKVEDLIYILNRERPSFAGLDAATAYFAELLADRDILLVIDDVWSVVHLRPFLQGGKHCARLITTRNEDVLPSNAQPVQVDAMLKNEAVELLSAGLGSAVPSMEDTKELYALAARLGEWPLLLKLVNGVLRERVSKYRQPLSNALFYINKALDKRGLTAFDAKNSQERNQAVAKTLQASFELLDVAEYSRYRELAIFPEDVDIPFITLQKLWGVTGCLDDFDTEELCERLHSLSLLLKFDPVRQTIRLHDVIRTYLQQDVGEALVAIHGYLLTAYSLQRWAQLAHNEPYMWKHLAYHLLNAGREEELVTTVKDLFYLATKAFIYNTYSIETDLGLAEKYAPDDVSLLFLRRYIPNIGYLLDRCRSFKEVAMMLYNYLLHLNNLSQLCRAFEPEIPRPFFISWCTLPDLPHPALIRTLQGHTSEVNACAISPNGDFIVSASTDKTLKIWDARTGQERMTISGYAEPITSCAVSPDGKYIVSALGNMLKVTDVDTGKELLTLQGHKGRVDGCAISPNGKYIVSASADGMLKVWNAKTGQEHLTFAKHTSCVVGCAVSLVGNYVVSASLDTDLRVWDIGTGKEHLVVYGLAFDLGGTSCAVSPRGDYAILSLWNGVLKVWNLNLGEEQEPMKLRGHKDGINSCAVSPAGDYIISASWDRTLRVWDAYTGRMRMTLRGHTGRVRGCAVSPTGDYIVSTSDDKTLKLWDVREIKVRQIVRGHMKPVWCCAVSPTGDYIVSASVDGALRMWNAQTGKAMQVIRGHKEPVTGCTISPTEDWIVSASEDGTLKIWDVQTKSERMILRGHTARVNGCAVSPAGDYVISASWDKTLKVWDVRTGEEHLTLQGHKGEVNGCAMSRRGDYIVSASQDKTLKVWSMRTGKVRSTLRGHTDGVIWCAVSPLDDYIVSTSWDKTLKVWDVRTGKERLTLEGHTDVVTQCAVDLAGGYILSSSADGTLKAWDVQTGECLATLRVYAALNACIFYPDGEHVVAGGESGLYFLRLVL